MDKILRLKFYGNGIRFFKQVLKLTYQGITTCFGDFKYWLVQIKKFYRVISYGIAYS